MFTIYNSFTGEIKRHSQFNETNFGEGALKGHFNKETHYVKRGEAVELPPKLANEPHFDYLIERWVDVVGLDFRNVIERRNKLLSDSDWTQLSDVPLETKAKWLDYRQALRDISSQPDYPNKIVWPEKPKTGRQIIEQPQSKEL